MILCLVQDDAGSIQDFISRREAINVNKLFILCIMTDNEVPQEETERSTTVTILVENERPVATDEVEEKSRSSSLAWSTQGSMSMRLGEKFRSLTRRSSVENFGQFGFLVPALALFPQADGVSFINLSS